MDDFRRKQRELDKQRIDAAIFRKIEEVLNKLENEVEEETYKQQIQNRKKILGDIYKSFDYNMEIMDEQKQRDKYSIKNKSVDQNKELQIKRALDKIMKEGIERELDKFYQKKNEVLNAGGNRIESYNKETYSTFFYEEKKLTQEEEHRVRILTLVLERSLKTSEFLEDCDGNLERIQRYEQNRNNVRSSEEKGGFTL